MKINCINYKNYQNQSFKAQLNKKSISVNFNESDNKECKEYFMNYELDNYITKVYTDPIEGWQNCIVLDVLNSNQEIERAIVITKSGTQLNRIAKFVDEDDEIIPDGCIYFIDKNIS